MSGIMRRFTTTVASAAPAAAQAAVTVGSSAGSSNVSALAERLSVLRNRLERGPALGDFVTETTSIASAACGIPVAELPTATSGKPAPKNDGPPKPAWLKITTPTKALQENFDRLRTTVKSLNLATVCEEAKCPNIGQCWGGKEGTATATIMLMGDTCTRGCYFCNVKTSRNPPPLDPAEPKRVAEAVTSWGLSYVVLTSVDRDDLVRKPTRAGGVARSFALARWAAPSSFLLSTLPPHTLSPPPPLPPSSPQADQGSAHLASTVRHIKAAKPSMLVECLAPDFRGEHGPIDTVASSGLDVFAHNLETVQRLQGRVRDHRAGWDQSLRTLQRAKEAVPSLITKTSLMLGVGETDEDLRAAIRDIRSAGIDVITFGQYLRPTRRHLPVERYVPPEEFDAWRAEAEAAGFLGVFSGPLVRSSYKAGELFLEQVLAKRKVVDAAAA